MIDELKRDIKLIKFGFSFKTNLICGILFFTVGVIYSCFIDFELGFFYLMLGPMFITYFFRKNSVLIKEGNVTKSFLVIGLFSILLLVYMTASFRSFAISTLIFVIGFMYALAHFC